MAAKRKPMLPDDLDLDEMTASPGHAAPQPFLHQGPPAVAAAEPVPVGKIGLKEKAVNMSIYLLPDDHRRLRRLAVDHDTSIQTLVLDGIDAVLAQHGLPPVTRWETRRKIR
jgi:hypothetical protein